MDNCNPSCFLFPLSQLSGTSATAVSEALNRLELVYSTHESRISRRHVYAKRQDAVVELTVGMHICQKTVPVDQDTVIDSGYASEEEEDQEAGLKEPDEEVELIRADAFERSFAVRWLTGFISRSCAWTYPSAEVISDEEVEEREVLMERAASLLAVCSGSEDQEEALTRDFDFPLGKQHASLGLETSIFVELNDAPLSSTDHSSVGLQSWASSIVFARMLCEDPAAFGLVPTRDNFRVLELGAGTGLLSIASAKLLSVAYGARGGDEVEVVATDYHPDVLSNLRRNVASNFPTATFAKTSPVDVRTLDWQAPSDEAPFDMPFDVILAADVVYGPEHASWIKKCVERLLRRPSPICPDGGTFWLVFAIRSIGRHEGLDATVLEAFPPCLSHVDGSSGLLSLKSVETQELARSDGVGRADESGYRLYKIRWR